NSNQNQLLKYYYELGARSLIICPLKCDDGQLIGILEIMSDKPEQLKFTHLTRLQPALPLFILALERSSENLELQIDKIIKEHFTAIQPAVEWKFTEAAFNYLKNKQINEATKMQPIIFDDVYPLYGAIDIRNSSIERNNAIQLDVAEQLHLARKVLEKVSKGMNFPLLKEVIFKIDKYIATTSDSLLSDDEMLIYDFLQVDLEALLQHLRTIRPGLKKTIDEYYAALDPQRKIIYHHRKDYEESINRINDALDRFIDQEQQVAQQVYPHYFERYITDGIDFNIYVGQSLAPHHPFNEIYVRNLKLWQLTMLTKAARLTHALEKKMPLPLQSTQLILAHSIPLTISFRRKERKFDVEGAYNIRYEIIKKRIDKVNLKDSNERLTQPGKVAIVYSQQKELNEYLEYIEFLQNENLLTGDVEHVELEDTQGINGLKAIRVDVQLNVEAAPSNVELSKVTSKQLLQK
ncbi:MAG: GAF domain-containing protein, partial [Bacteroidota bacterium]|nr:GAF domain-containing protein [Bacteroidota bacterium]